MSEASTAVGGETSSVVEVLSDDSFDAIDDLHARVSCCVLFLREGDAGGASASARRHDATDEVAFGGD
jgi:hypothetical protein